jgi:hypothetical protein
MEAIAKDEKLDVVVLTLVIRMYGAMGNIWFCEFR